MSEETTTPEVAEAPEGQNINITIEQILAATLKSIGSINVPVADLVANYSTYSISVTQEEDGTVTFALTEIPAIEDVVEPTEAE